MSEQQLVTFTVKELFQRIELQLGRVENKLDTELSDLAKRVALLESYRDSSKYLIDEFEEMRGTMAAFQTFKARFLPAGIVVALISGFVFVLDIYDRHFT
jgi:hypothetical protein